MTAYKFYYYFGLFVEVAPIIPFIIGLLKWQLLPNAIKTLICFLFFELILNLISDYFLFNRINNLFLSYFYSFFQITFTLIYFTQISTNKEEKIIILSLIFISYSLLILEFFTSNTKFGNYFSGIFVDIAILMVSLFYFHKHLKVSNHTNSTITVFSIAATILLYFIRIIDIFLSKYLLETQSNTLLWLDEKTIYYYFLLFSWVIYSYALISFRKYENS